MAKRGNFIAKFFAFLALFWIVIWIIWTWVLFLIWGGNTSSQTQTMSYDEFQKLVESWAFSWELSWNQTASGETSTWDVNIATWEIVE